MRTGFFRRTPAERRLALEALVLFAWARLSLRFFSLGANQRGLRLLAMPFQRHRLPPREAIPLIAWAVTAVARRWPGQSTCLPEALVAHCLLNRRGIAARLRIGVQRPGEQIGAHAWVEHRDQVVFGELDDLPTFNPLQTEAERIVRRLAAVLRGEPVTWASFATSADAFLAACSDQDLTGLVYRQIVAHGPGGSWPDSMVQRLAASARADVGAEMARTRETMRVLDALATAGVHPLLFKGTALAHTVYPQPALRPRNDTDLLIRGADRPATEATFRALGYQAPTYCDGEVLFRQFELQRRDELGVAHAYDIHWGLSTQALFADLFTFDDLEATAVPAASLGARARTLGTVEALVWSCVHPAMHHRNEERLIWVYDTHLLALRLSPADWDRFAATAITKSVAAICADGLGRSAARLDTPVPPWVLDRLDSAATRPEPSARYLEEGRKWSNEVAANLTAMGWRDRLRLVREVAFPAPRYMLAAYGVAGARFGPALLPALYAHRGARGLWKVLTGRK